MIMWGKHLMSSLEVEEVPHSLSSFLFLPIHSPALFANTFSFPGVSFPSVSLWVWHCISLGTFVNKWFSHSWEIVFMLKSKIVFLTHVALCEGRKNRAPFTCPSVRHSDWSYLSEFSLRYWSFLLRQHWFEMNICGDMPASFSPMAAPSSVFMLLCLYLFVDFYKDGVCCLFESFSILSFLPRRFCLCSMTTSKYVSSKFYLGMSLYS